MMKNPAYLAVLIGTIVASIIFVASIRKHYASGSTDTEVSTKTFGLGL